MKCYAPFSPPVFKTTIGVDLKNTKIFDLNLPGTVLICSSLPGVIISNTFSVTKVSQFRDFPGGPVVKALQASTSGGTDQRTKMPHVTWHSKKKKKYPHLEDKLSGYHPSYKG